MNRHSVQRELDRLDHEDVVDMFARIPERRRELRSPRPSRRRGRRPLLLALVAAVAAPLVVLLAAPGLVPEWALDLVGKSTSGHYAFLYAQPDGEHAPVGWDPCRPVDVVVNPTGAPADGVATVREAMAAVQKATGIRLRFEGLTGDSESRPTPRGVLVSWGTVEQDNGFAGSELGHARSVPGVTAAGRLVYVRGDVTLSQPAFARIGHAEKLAVTEHELGHVMGLGHVSDPRQLMYPSMHGQRGFAAGDLGGLAVLGNLPCG